MDDGRTYRIVNKEVIRLGMEKRLDRLFREWIYPDLIEQVPDFMQTAKTFRPVGGGNGNVVYFTAEVEAPQVIEYSSFVWDTMLKARSEKEVQELYDEFHACVESVHRLSLVEVMTEGNPGIEIAPPRGA
jgi:hypothetical protein